MPNPQVSWPATNKLVKQLRTDPATKEMFDYPGPDMLRYFLLADGRILVTPRIPNGGRIWASKEHLDAIISQSTAPRHWILTWLADCAGFVRDAPKFAAEAFAILGLPADDARPSRSLIAKIDAQIGDPRNSDWEGDPLVPSLCALAGEWFISLHGGVWRLEKRDPSDPAVGVPAVVTEAGHIYSPFDQWDALLEGEFDPGTQDTSSNRWEAIRLRDKPFRTLCLEFYESLPK